MLGGYRGFDNDSSEFEKFAVPAIPPLGEKMGKNFSSCPDCHTPIGHLIFIFF
jgi:hypothetical protein